MRVILIQPMSCSRLEIMKGIQPVEFMHPYEVKKNGIGLFGLKLGVVGPY